MVAGRGFGTEDMGFEPQIRKAVKEVKDTLRSAVVNSQGVTVGQIRRFQEW